MPGRESATKRAACSARSAPACEARPGAAKRQPGLGGGAGARGAEGARGAKRLAQPLRPKRTPCYQRRRARPGRGAPRARICAPAKRGDGAGAPVARRSRTRSAPPRGSRNSRKHSEARLLHARARLAATGTASGALRRRCAHCARRWRIAPETAPRHAAVGDLLLDIGHIIPSKCHGVISESHSR